MDTTVAAEDSNDLFRLTLQLSDDIVTTDGSIDLNARIVRLQDKQINVSTKVQGVWNVQSIGNDVLDPNSVEIVYTFNSDSTVAIQETHKFDVSILGSRVLGVWDVYVINSDTLNPDSLSIQYTFSNDSSITLDSVVIDRDTSRISRDGEWRFNYRDTTLSVLFWDTPGGEIESGTVRFDSDALTIPINAFMYWTTDTRRLILRKTDDRNGFDVPEDSVNTNSGGWIVDPTNDHLTVTVQENSISGEVRFDTEGSTVPIDGFMFWDTETSGLYIFKKFNHIFGSSEAMSTKLSIDAIGGTIDILNFTLPSNIQVSMGDTVKSKFEVEGLFTPRNMGTSTKPVFKEKGMVSAKFQDLFVKIAVTVVTRTSP